MDNAKGDQQQREDGGERDYDVSGRDVLGIE
jgi:hypothetical protein